MFNFVIELAIVICIHLDIETQTERDRGQGDEVVVVGDFEIMNESCLKTTVRYNSAKSNYALFFKSKQLTQQKPLVRQCHCQRREARRHECMHI